MIYLQCIPSLDITHLLDGDRNLSKCFGIFHAIHDMIRTREILSRIIDDVLFDFMKDNVIYLEIRTTPRNLPGKVKKICRSYYA